MAARRTTRTGSARPATARFDYYKVQVWNPRTCAWSPIKGMHDTEAAGWAACPAGQTCRLMHMTPGNQTPITR